MVHEPRDPETNVKERKKDTSRGRDPFTHGLCAECQLYWNLSALTANHLIVMKNEKITMDEYTPISKITFWFRFFFWFPIHSLAIMNKKVLLTALFLFSKRNATQLNFRVCRRKKIAQLISLIKNEWTFFRLRYYCIDLFLSLFWKTEIHFH